MIPTLKQEELPDDPFVLFRTWLDQAVELSGLDNPNAVFLSTVSEDGVPEGRIVLLKQVDGDGFVFFTNRESRKGRNIAARPHASLTSFWDVLGRQVRIVGAVEHVADDESDAYFASRTRASQVGAWASEQSRPLEDRAALVERVQKFADQFEGQDVPRPPHWGGFRVRPTRIEFWQNGESRLHDRFEYQRAGDGSWSVRRLNP